MENQLDQGVVNLAKAIRQTESGGNFQLPGKSGEYGGYQFTEPTWKSYSSKYGINTPLKEATPEQQNAVVYNKIKEWKDSGKDVTQIASMWNAGEGEPDAYTGKFKDGRVSSSKLPGGKKNSYGVEYDVPGYAKKVATEYVNLKNSSTNPSNTEKNLTFADIKQKDAETTPVSNPNAPGNVMSNLSEGNYGKALQSGIRGFANLATFGGSEQLGGYLGTKIANLQATPENKQYVDQTGGSTKDLIEGGLKTGLGIATIVEGGGLLNKVLGKGANVITKIIKTETGVTPEIFKTLSKAEKYNIFSKTLETAQPYEKLLIIKAMEKLKPGAGLLKRILSTGGKELSRFALYNTLGNKAGGLIHGVLHD